MPNRPIPRSLDPVSEQRVRTLVSRLRDQRRVLHANVDALKQTHVSLTSKLRALRDVCAQGGRLPPEVEDIVTRIDRLSPQQRRVLEKVVAGDSNKVIAYDLGLSQKTVETHRARVMRKMNASSLAHLVRLAGWRVTTEPPPPGTHRRVHRRSVALGVSGRRSAAAVSMVG